MTNLEAFEKAKPKIKKMYKDFSVCNINRTLYKFRCQKYDSCVKCHKDWDNEEYNEELDVFRLKEDSDDKLRSV